MSYGNRRILNGRELSCWLANIWSRFIKLRTEEPSFLDVKLVVISYLDNLYPQQEIQSLLFEVLELKPLFKKTWGLNTQHIDGYGILLAGGIMVYEDLYYFNDGTFYAPRPKHKK